jgi:hypothetical protein
MSSTLTQVPTPNLGSNPDIKQLALSPNSGPNHNLSATQGLKSGT